MKKILMLCLALVMGVGMCAAEKPANKKTVTTVFTTDIDCEHCVKKIMNNVPSLGKGVKERRPGFVIEKGGLWVLLFLSAVCVIARPIPSAVCGLR